MKLHVVIAIFKRNLVSYFSNPTGYVFICVFVLLSALAAFWPNEFFNANLANLDQLNKYLPHIMLIFIPAITMSIWAEERRQGTDELVLTIPAGDLDVVIGKYLAAVAIFSASLLFSLVSNLAVLTTLGNPDLGLFMATYFGYWMLGVAMVAIGMVASFLTSNLTVSFILGAAFNAPLVFASSAEVILPPGVLSEAVHQASFSEQFRDFGRGVVSLSSVAYFVSIVVLMLYVSMVLIGRRHWLGGRRGQSMLGHYVVRCVALLGAAVGLTVLFSYHDLIRIDATSERLSSLSRDTKRLIANLDPKRPVYIDAYVSPQVPEYYVQTRLNLLSMLEELKQLNRDKIVVNVHPTEKFSEAAERAEEQFGITSQQVASRRRGAINLEEIYLGLAFTSGLDKVVVPFVDLGVPIEYELVRSIATVADEQRKRVGVLSTDARLYGGFDTHSFSQRSNERIVEELQKQYDVVQVNASSPITQRFDVLLAVQPSSLPQAQMENFVAAIRNGQPTAIFEDPLPYLDRMVPGTSERRRPPGGAMGMFGGNQMQPEPKGDINALWDLLKVQFTPFDIVWQDYNPHKKIQQFPKQFVFIERHSGAEEPFNEQEAISSKLQEVLFLYPGAFSERQFVSHSLEFTPLLTTNDRTGEVGFGEVVQTNFLGQTSVNPNVELFERRTQKEYHIAARIRGEVEVESGPGSDVLSGAGNGDDSEGGVPEGPVEKKKSEIDVVVVADIDALYSAFFELRARGDRPEAEVPLRFDNVTFVLNVIDVLAGDDRFLEIRKRRPVHRVLTTVERATEAARDEFMAARDRFVEQFEEAKEKEEEEFDKRMEELRGREGGDALTRQREVEMAEEAYRNRMNATIQRLEQERDKEIKRIETELALKIRAVQDRYKLMAVSLPPIPPLLLGIAVFGIRRSREREGVARSRLR